MNKLACILVLTASFNLSATPDSDNQQDSYGQQSLLDAIFNPRPMDDGCDDFPHCEIDISMSQSEKAESRFGGSELSNNRKDNKSE